MTGNFFSIINKCSSARNIFLPFYLKKKSDFISISLHSGARYNYMHRQTLKEGAFICIICSTAKVSRLSLNTPRIILDGLIKIKKYF